MKNIFSRLIICCGLFAAVHSAVAQTWTQASAPNLNWFSIASSADGTKLFAVNYAPPDPIFLTTNYSPLYISTNSGMTWTPSGPSFNSVGSFAFNWNYVTSSADGESLAVTVGASETPLFFSTNSGSTWLFGGPSANGLFGPNAWDFPGGWSAITSSADGGKIFAIGQGFFSVSFDSGTTWTNQSALAWEPTCLASSADGTKLIVGSVYDTIYLSTNSGTTWQASSLSNQLYWSSVASSADGRKLVAAVYPSSAIYSNGVDYYFGGPIFVSADFGVTWSQTSAPITNWQSVVSSADGSKLVAAVSGGQIYSSTNSGLTWTVADVPSTNWQSVAVSADGKKLVAVAATGGIWTSQTTPSPQLSLSSSNSIFMLSWVVPSMNFVLQQSLDFTSWSAVTNAPVLNFTNLQYQVSLASSNSGGFFRLISQ